VTWIGSRVCPEKIAHESFLWRFSKSESIPDVLECDAIIGRQASVADHNLLVDDIAERQSAK
jgi:hypothetical protein